MIHPVDFIDAAAGGPRQHLETTTMKTPKPLTLHDVSWELDRIAGAACMSDAAREAAQRAGELVRAVRAGLDLDWATAASDLHRIGQDVQRREA